MLIIRPRNRNCIRADAIWSVGATLAMCAVGAQIAGVIGALAMLIPAYMLLLHPAFRLLRRGNPIQAIVATPDVLALLGQSGARLYIPWSQIDRAVHASDGVNWRWSLTAGGVRYVVRDAGVEGARWGLLWRHIVRQTCRAGRTATVDPISDCLFDS